MRRGPAPAAGPAAPDVTDEGLERAVGYRVHEIGSPSDGRLAWLDYASDDGRVVTLMVRPAGWRGLFARHERAIPASRVRAIDHGGRGILTSPTTRSWA